MSTLHRGTDDVPTSDEDWHGNLRGGLRLNAGSVELAVGDALVAALHPDPDEAAREAGYGLGEMGQSLGHTERDTMSFAVSDCGREELLPQARHAAAHAMARVEGAARRRAALAALVGLTRLLRGYEEHPETYIPAPARDLLEHASEGWRDADPLAVVAREVLQEIEPADERPFARALRVAWGHEAEAPLERVSARGAEEVPSSKEECARRYLLNAIVNESRVPTITECTKVVGCTRPAADKWPEFRAAWDRAKAAERASPRRGIPRR